MSRSKGKCVIVAAPSGAGKTSIVHKLLEKGLGLSFSVSATSRPKREGEHEGEDYYFLSPDGFRKKASGGELIEWEEVYPDRFYGTLRSEVERIWEKGDHVIFDVDVIGALNLKERFGEDALAIFIKPPSIEELEKRIRNRGTEKDEELRERVRKAEEEMSHAPYFDHVVVNDDLDRASRECEKLVRRFLSL